jgi:hypothetical protein
MCRTPLLPKTRHPEWSVYVDLSHALIEEIVTLSECEGPRSRERREAVWRETCLAGGIGRK